MNKILIISNVRCEELGKFIEQKGTFTVAGCYNSISENLLEIQSKILDVSKTLYLYQPEEGPTNIRADMQVLQNLIKSNGFFKPGEISFITRTSQQCKQAERYFVTVMKECSYNNYSIKNIEEAISFTNVYDSLMGISYNENFKNSYTTYYRTKRNEDSSVMYEGQDDKNLMIEPYSFDNLREFESQRKVALSMSSSIQFRDEEDSNLTKYKHPNFEPIEVTDIFGGPEVIILSGKPKSGLSTWCSALAVSATKAGKSVLVIDYTANSDVSYQLVGAKVTYNEVRIKDILQHNGYREGLSICSLHSSEEHQIRFNFLQSVFNNKMFKQEIVLISVDYRDFERTIEILKLDVRRVFLTTVPRKSDVIELLDYIELLSAMEVFVIMNDCLKKYCEGLLTQVQVKEMLSTMNVKVVDSCWFDSIDVGTNLYSALL